MHISSSVSNLQEQLTSLTESGHTIGFVPTMGALHDGHLSLVEKAKLECDVVVVSVFVNPTQFNDPNDLANYPRNEEKDAKLLEEANCDIMFVPTVQDIYPNESKPEFELNALDSVLEGTHRPGHFNGVVQVVDRLFQIVKPNSAYFGQKDFQQLAIIKYSMPMLGHATKVVGCPTKREQSGLAMSSRNQLLSEKARNEAVILFNELSEASRCFSSEPSNRMIEARAIERITAAGLDPEYFEIVDPLTLQPKPDLDKGEAVACVAARIDGVRLIDNMMLFG